MRPADVRTALQAELAATPEYYDFKVQRTERDGALWRVTLESGYLHAEGQAPGATTAQSLLDDSLDGASAWWGAPAKGGASVLAVVPQDDQLVLQNATTPPPGTDHLIRLYPTRFLTAVADAWADDAWAERALAGLPDLKAPRPADDPGLTGEPFRWLRPAQRAALALPRHTSAFLWGPPGTGKTTTLGVLVGEYLARRPQSRVLLLSTTNQAVDLATLAVDKALQKARRDDLRPAVQRLGTRLDAAAYEGREHLVPEGDPRLIARLARAEAARPPGQDAAALKAWADHVAALRSQLRASSLQVLRRCRLASMTTTRAVFTLRTLRELVPGEATPFDLVVFDEASQVSLAHALALMPLGRARLFAGDPQQLAPVLRSADRGARKWLGRSPFDEMPRGGPSVALLDEQSRMAGPISDLVSELFYDGALRLASDAQAAPAWLAARRRAFGPIDADTHVHVWDVRADGGWSARARGPIRTESADIIATLVADALAAGQWRPDELIVLTPFRAQRALIRQRLQARGVQGVRVSTVHRAQGSEALAVLFDPADGTQRFLHTPATERLLNVALSRAQAKVVLLMSRADAANPLLGKVVARLRLAADGREATPLAQFAARPDFPSNAVGHKVRAGRVVGEVARASADGARFWLLNERTGALQEFDAAFWRAKARHSTD